MITRVLCCNTPLIQYIGELNVFACSRCEEKYCSQFSLIIVSRDLERTGGGGVGVVGGITDLYFIAAPCFW